MIAVWAAVVLSCEYAVPSVAAPAAGWVTPNPEGTCQPTVKSLPLVPAADGGFALDDSPDGYVGYLHHGDGTINPAQWHGSPSSGFTITDLGLRDSMSAGFVSSAMTTGALLVVYFDATSEHGRTYQLTGDAWLPVLGPNANADVYGLAQSENGDLIGYYKDSNKWQPAVWRGTSEAAPLDPLTGFTEAIPEWINAHGDVVGESATTGQRVATVWTGRGRAFAGPRLSASSANVDGAFTVIDSGRIGGTAWGLDGREHAIAADPFSGPIDLGVFPGDDWAIIWGLSSAGRAVGDSGGATTGGSRALYWSGTGPLLILPGPSGTGPTQRSAAFGVNDAGDAWGVSTRSLTEPYQPTVWSCIDQLAVPVPDSTSDRRLAPSATLDKRPVLDRINNPGRSHHG